MSEAVSKHVGIQTLDPGLVTALADDLHDAVPGERAVLAEP